MQVHPHNEEEAAYFNKHKAQTSTLKANTWIDTNKRETHLPHWQYATKNCTGSKYASNNPYDANNGSG